MTIAAIARNYREMCQAVACCEGLKRRRHSGQFRLTISKPALNLVFRALTHGVNRIGKVFANGNLAKK
jgi:hypothetical protein